MTNTHIPCCWKILATLALIGFGCGEDVIAPNRAVHPRQLLTEVSPGEGTRLYAAGFGDDTLRVWSVDDALTLNQVLWAGGDVEPGNLGTVGPALSEGLSGPWGLAMTSSGAIVVTSKLSATLQVLSSGTGALTTVASVTQGALVESPDSTAGLVLARGLERVGAVATENGWIYGAGLDGLGVYSFNDEDLAYVGSSADLAGADDILVVSTSTLAPEPSGRLILARCRQREFGAPCLSASDPSELVVANRDPSGIVSVASRWAHNGEAVDGREMLLGDGHLATAERTDGSHLVLAAFEGSAAVVALRLDAQGTLTSTGARRIVAPWQDPASLPAFDADYVSTSTQAPLRSAQIALLGQTIFVAVRSGGFVAHFPISCLGQATETDGCLETTCLDEAGGCTGPSDASITSTYPQAITASESRVYVGIDVRTAAGTITSRIAILEVDEAGTIALVGITDA